MEQTKQHWELLISAKDVGRALFAARKQLKLNRVDLAIYFCVNNFNIYQYENGKSEIPFEAMIKLFTYGLKDLNK